MCKWQNISDLEDCETLNDAIKRAKYILSMYNEPETSFYDCLHCDYTGVKTNTPEEVRATARKHITKLKAFIKKNQ